MGPKDTGTVNSESDAGAGLGRSINRDPGDNGPLNSSATKGTRGYNPVKFDLNESVSYNTTAVKVRVTPDTVKASGGGVAGAFFTMRTVAGATIPAENGDIYLQGGMVSAGTGNSVVADILLFDASAGAVVEGVPEGEWQGSPDDILTLTLNGLGQETSGILDPIFNGDGAAITGDSIPPPADGNILPAHGALTGKVVLMLGNYFEGGFSPSGAGNFHITFCYGAFTISRT